MSMTSFFTLHSDLPREGPGEDADVFWAASLAGLGNDARICDAACGPGADINAQLTAAPQGQVLAFDRHAPFVDVARSHFKNDPRVTLELGQLVRTEADGLPDPVDLGPFDMIWCAGAMYFTGIEPTLTHWKNALKPGGVIAFSEPVFFTETPAEIVRALYGEYGAMTDAAGIRSQIERAGYEVLDTKPVSDDAWEAYYTPMDARIAALRPDADPALREVLDEGTEEARVWREYRDQVGYLLCVVRPK